MEIYKIKYRTENISNNLRILGENFVKNNRNKVKLIINNKKVYLKDKIPVQNSPKMKLIIILIRAVNNRSCMFKNCESLESLEQLPIDNYSEYLQNEDVQTEKETKNFFIENEEHPLFASIYGPKYNDDEFYIFDKDNHCYFDTIKPNDNRNYY